MRKILLLTLLFGTYYAHAQSEPDTSKPSQQTFIYAGQTPEPNNVKYSVLDTADEMPEPDFDVRAYLQENLSYPLYAKEHNITGKVVVKFIVHEDGSMSDAHVIQGIGGGCDEEVLRIIRNAPLWKPGKIDGKPVKVWYTQTINFQIAGPGSSKRKKNARN